VLHATQLIGHAARLLYLIVIYSFKLSFMTLNLLYVMGLISILTIIDAHVFKRFNIALSLRIAELLVKELLVNS